MPHIETKVSTGTADFTPPPGKGCQWVVRILKFVSGAHYHECQDGKKVYYDEKITHTVTPGPGGSCHVVITTTTTITYTDEPCEVVET
jgi:hypothetical protein